ncbi:MAG: hypothetical protein DYG95_23605 [Chlorobi bacterium CHB1]|nr:hypothetical protein [Chlorobi bacterium CHB1]
MSLLRSIGVNLKGWGESKSPNGAAYESLGQGYKPREFLFPRALPFAITFVPVGDWRFLLA